MKGRLDVARRAAVAAALLAASARGMASAAGIAEIQEAIQAQGGRWVAEENALSRLPDAEKAQWLGALSDGPVPDQTLPEPGHSAAAAMPPGFDWRDVGGRSYVTPVKNQGRCGSCWTFSTTAALESYLLIRAPSAVVPDNAEQLLLSCSGAGSCAGGWPTMVSAYIARTGVPPEPYFPYEGTNGRCTDARAGWQEAAAKIGSYAGVAKTVAALKHALVQHGPLPTTFSVYQDFYSYKSGVYSYATGKFIGRHAVLIVGYDDAERCFIVKNSWGEGWGERGYFRVAYSELDSVMGFGVETLAYLPPRPPRAAPLAGALESASEALRAITADPNGSDPFSPPTGD